MASGLEGLLQELGPQPPELVGKLNTERTELAQKIERLKDRKSTRLNSSHIPLSRMPSSA